MKKLNLEKIQITKLENSNLIRGGGETTGDDGTVLAQKKRKCINQSRDFVWENRPNE